MMGSVKGVAVALGLSCVGLLTYGMLTLQKSGSPAVSNGAVALASPG